MAIGDFFTGIGQGIGRGLTKIGGYDPMQQVSSEEAARRRQEGLAALERSFGRSSAILSGDPQRLALAEKQMQQAKQDKLLQQLAQDPRYAEQIKLLRAGLDPRLAAGTTKTGSVERFSVYSNKAGRPVGSVLKTDAETIAKIQADPDLQIVPLSAPSREKDGSIEILQMVDANDNFITKVIYPNTYLKWQQYKYCKL